MQNAIPGRTYRAEPPHFVTLCGQRRGARVRPPPRACGRDELGPFSTTAVPFWGQSTLDLSGMSTAVLNGLGGDVVTVALEGYSVLWSSEREF